MSIEDIKFSIIIPTFNRKDLLERALSSLVIQRCTRWKAYVVDDSTDDQTFRWINSITLDSRITYYKNPKNMGVNYSRNFGVSKVEEIGVDDYLIFLDDDDLLNTNALSDLEVFLKTTTVDWLVTNRENVTRSKLGRGYFSYVKDYLLGTRLSGDVTHIIQLKAFKKTRGFSTKIKNGYELIFFSDLSRLASPYYLNQNTQLSGGYFDDGLSKNLTHNFKNFILLFYEMARRERAALFFMLFLKKLKNMLI